MGIKGAREISDAIKELCLSPLLQKKKATAVTTVKIYSQKKHEMMNAILTLSLRGHTQDR